MLDDGIGIFLFSIPLDDERRVVGVKVIKEVDEVLACKIFSSVCPAFNLSIDTLLTLVLNLS